MGAPSPAVEPEPILRIGLRPPRFWDAQVAMNLGMIALVALFVLPLVLAEFLPAYAGVAEFMSLGLAVFGSAAYLAWRRLRFPRSMPPIEVRADGLLLPRRVDDARRVHLPWEAIRSVELRFPLPVSVLIVESDRGTFVVPAQHLLEPEAIEPLAVAIRRHAARVHGGEAFLAQLREREARARRLLSRPPAATFVILVVLAVAYLVESLVVAGRDPILATIELGANVPAFVRAGEYFRLVSANFLHAGLGHLILNGLAIAFLGLVLERIIGTWRFVVVYLLSALGGAAASALAARAPLSVGASTAVFGLLGALGVVQLLHHRRLPAGFRQSLRWWVLILGLNGLLSMLEFVDGWAHLGGFLTGAVVAVPLCARPTFLEPSAPTPLPIRLLAVSLIALTLAGLVAAVDYAASGNTNAKRQMLVRVLEQEDLDPGRLNMVAWKLAIDPGAPRVHLEAARRAAERAVAEDPNPAHRDTLAQLLHRLGEAEAAVRLELEVLHSVAGRPDARVYATQLAKFAAAAKAAGMHLVPEDSPPVSVRFEPVEGSATPKWVEVEVGGPPAKPLEIVAPYRQQGRLAGLVLACAGREGSRRVPLRAQRLFQPRPRGQVKAEVDAVLTGTCRPSEEGIDVWVWVGDPEMLSLP
ncbi:MAG: rhomboid family intramembrane serine protease [Deltaproteobacteria bacterium]|nr:MAG: rhomboid family intramembrane serine protease [Deltaproteobacteria bacterium]